MFDRPAGVHVGGVPEQLQRTRRRDVTQLQVRLDEEWSPRTASIAASLRPRPTTVAPNAISHEAAISRRETLIEQAPGVDNRKTGDCIGGRDRPAQDLAQ